MKKALALSLVTVIALTLSLVNLTGAGAAEENVTLLADSYTTTTGSDGGQPVTNLHVLDQGGWDTYVEFYGKYAGYRVYTLPSYVDPASITGMEVKVSWQGSEKSYQRWSWSIRDFTNSTWVYIGDNTGAPDWDWWVKTFTVSGNFADYVSGGKIRIRLESNNSNDDCDLDYEHVKVYYTSGPTDTPVPPTDTPIPPTDTPIPPTDTPVPPTDTPIPPTDTPVPPTDTPAPPTDTPIPGSDNFETGVKSAVGGTWTTVNLANSYTSPVVVCTVNYANNTTPVVARVRNVSSTSFEVKLQNPSGGSVAADDVHYVVMEEGQWELPDGTPIEAARVTSDGTNENNDWSTAAMESYTYQNSYSSPVVLGQVMSANDADWSVFWTQGSSRTAPPSSSTCYVGKEVAEDTDTTRATETLGVIVIETASGTVEGVNYQSFLGGDTVKGVGNAPPYSYSLSGFSSTPEVGIAVQAAMDGGNGGWAVLYGASPLSSSSIGLAIDEDQINDSERSHITEQVGVLVFESAVSLELTAPGPSPTDTPVPPTDTPTSPPPTDTPAPPTDTPTPPPPTDTPAPGDNSYVSPDGNCDGKTPCYTTIQAAVNAATAGTTINVMNGEYNESVVFPNSGSASNGYITLQNYPGHSPVIDGTGVSINGETGLIVIENKSYIKVIGFEIRDLKAGGNGNVFPAGIWVRGYGDHIEIRNNVVHDIENSSSSSGAHGIAVYGRNSSASIHDIVLDGNEVYNCQLGWSESIVLNGNVEFFTVSNNVVHDNDNIGIDFIGWEGECSGCGDDDRARDGTCVGNTVYNIDSKGNPAYGNDRSADGIYVDGGTRITIEKNVVHHANIGIELASEHKGKDTSYITVRNNFVYNCHVAGIAIGGYDKQRGYTEGCNIVNNTLYHNDTDHTYSGELYVQFDTRNNVIKNNILYADSQNVLVTNDYTENTGNEMDYNIYYSPGGANGSEWQWKKQDYSSFSAWQSGTGNDAHGMFVNPQLVNPASGDLHIQSGSPAINAGANLSSDVIGTEDIDGDARIQGGTVDIGADERE